MSPKAKAKSKKTTPPQLILEAFERISAVPRRSKSEEPIRRFFLDWAKRLEFVTKVDEVGNLLIKVPASPGKERKPVVVIQGHLDMVCEKTPDSPHDFTKDPITFVHDGEWLRANQTSLGADNGIALALAMVLAEDPKIKHPPLELLFTVDEETGLTGAKGLTPGFFSGNILLNLDSEDEGVFTVGCAGGKDTHLELPLEYDETPDSWQPWRLRVHGLAGGHSGVNIHEQRANAISLLSRSLLALRPLGTPRLVNIQGGTAHNAIPRHAEAVFYLPATAAEQAGTVISKLLDVFRQEAPRTDPKLALDWQPAEGLADRRSMVEECSMRVVDLLLALPHGVAAKSLDMPDLVETSNNLAQVSVDAGKLFINTSQRSSRPSQLDFLTSRVEAVARLSGALVQSGNGYPPWQPNFSSPLLEMSKKIYLKTFDAEPKVEVIHAGLECGLIGNVQPGMDMISLGPTIKDPHCPDERLHIPSLDKLWTFLLELLKALS